jgi:hypothetical protein
MPMEREISKLFEKIQLIYTLVFIPNVYTCLSRDYYTLPNIETHVH